MTDALCSQFEGDDAGPDISINTALRTLQHAHRFFDWLGRQNGVTLPLDLAGYFSLTLAERRIAAVPHAKGVGHSINASNYSA